MQDGKRPKKKFRPDHVIDYFKAEYMPLLFVTISGLVYNIGLLASPWFEGQIAGRLLDILKGIKPPHTMLTLAIWYVAIIAIVQICRYVKRYYVRRFANNINRRMKTILYANIVSSSRQDLISQGNGSIMTKAVSDVDDCAEGMRKFTTEIFDTGVALICYIGMLFVYDLKLTLLCLIFPPVSYLMAEKMKVIVQKTGEAYKKQTERLSAQTMDLVSNALLYRIFGSSETRRNSYEKELSAYERDAIKSHVLIPALPPIYYAVSMMGVIFIIYYGSKNVTGTGAVVWDIAAFTTYLSCYTKMSVKSSKAAKLFNSVHKAQVSWKRIVPYLRDIQTYNEPLMSEVDEIEVSGVGVRDVFAGLQMTAQAGQIIGVTGPVACGKSILGRAFLREEEYEGRISFDGIDIQELDAEDYRGYVGYIGHDPELLNDTIRNNILMGQREDLQSMLECVCMDQEVRQMPDGADTMIGDGGIRLSGGQAKRVALARTLARPRPVYVLDDPFSALDLDTEQKIYENMRKITKDSIVILISHRLTLFPKMDQVVWMNDGKAVCSTHEELMKSSSEYAALYNAARGGDSDAE